MQSSGSHPQEDSDRAIREQSPAPSSEGLPLHETHPAGASPNPSKARTSQGPVLGLSQAADWIGVSHMVLRAALRNGRVGLLAGIRSGRSVRLVRVSDLLELFPTASPKTPAPACPDTQLCESDWSSDLRPLEPREPGGASSSATSPPSHAVSVEGTHGLMGRGPTGKPVTDSTENLRQQLDRTRADVIAARESNERLRQELLDSGEAIRGWIGQGSAGSQGFVSAPTISSYGTDASSTGGSDRRRGDHRTASGFRAARLEEQVRESDSDDSTVSQPGAKAGGAEPLHDGPRTTGEVFEGTASRAPLGGMAHPVESDTLMGPPQAKHASHPNPSILAHRVGLTVGVLLIGGALLSGSGIVGGLGWVKNGGEPNSDARVDPPAMGKGSLSVPALEQEHHSPLLMGPDSLGPDDEARMPTDEQLAALFGVIDLNPDSGVQTAPLGRAEPTPTENPIPDEPPLAHPEQDRAVLPELNQANVGPPGAPVLQEGPTPVARVIPGNSVLPIQTEANHEHGGVPCMYFSQTQLGSDLRLLLGPCQGRWSPSLSAVRATNHSSDHHTCRHHSFFQEVLGGDLDRAREQALVAVQSGFLPPMLRMRIERSAAALLRAEVPNWIESGFESGQLGEGHRISASEGGEGTANKKVSLWTVHSWVRYVDFAGVEVRREFQLDLHMRDGPSGDSLIKLSWIGE